MCFLARTVGGDIDSNVIGSQARARSERYDGTGAARRQFEVLIAQRRRAPNLVDRDNNNGQNEIIAGLIGDDRRPTDLIAMSGGDIFPIQSQPFDYLDAELAPQLQLWNAGVHHCNREVIRASGRRRADDGALVLLNSQSGWKVARDQLPGVRHNAAGDRHGQAVFLSDHRPLRRRRLYLQVLRKCQAMDAASEQRDDHQTIPHGQRLYGREDF